MKRAKILWADDEIDLLKPYILFLNEKGFDVVEVNNGRDAIELCHTQRFDIVFLDEHMPGISGLETLVEINDAYPDIPIVMITKSEDEGIMEKAIGRKITDYLIKPVNPHQILLVIKKILDKQEIILEANVENYRGDFAKLANEIDNCTTAEGWKSIYKRLVAWEIDFAGSNNPMNEILQMQKLEANAGFARYVRGNYENWFDDKQSESPLLSHNVFSDKVFPLLDDGEKVFLIIVDNFRLDQWESIKDMVSNYFTVKDELYFSILPTATQYARNAIFAGKTPLQISKQHSELWRYESDDDGKNISEESLIDIQLREKGRHERIAYHKINNNIEGEKILSDFGNLEANDLNVLVYNFIDILSHARTEQKMLQELVPNEAAYRSLTKAWFQHSPLLSLLKKISEKGYKVVFTTDHGTIRVRNPLKVIVERSVNSNPRYKVDRNLTYDTKKVFEIVQPEKVGLPSPNLSSRYIFALSDAFFVYPNNSNHYVSFYEDSFQHGGVSMEEMIVPLAVMTPK